MNVLLTCTECEYETWGSTQKELMNKIVMWNHVKKAHAQRAEHIMKLYQTLPDNLYGMHAIQPLETITA